MPKRTVAESVARARILLPYPRLWAKFTGTRIPSNYITGKTTGLLRPESVAFTPSGDLMAISNSGMHSVIMYRRCNDSGKDYDKRPCCTISDADCLNYVHDVAFSPYGTHFVAVSREAHSISMFALLNRNSNGIEAKMLGSFRGEQYGLSFPAGVAFHPSGQYLAVANRMRNGIALCRRLGSTGPFDSTPFQFITDEDLCVHGLAAPHGVDFSPDGMSLLVAHKRFFKAEHPQGESALSVFRCRTVPDFGLDPHPSFISLSGRTACHHVSFHPSGDIVAVANEAAGVDVYNWLPEQATMRKRDTISVVQIADGAKGVAFTREGRQVAVTTELDEVLFFDLVAGDSSYQ